MIMLDTLLTLSFCIGKEILLTVNSGGFLLTVSSPPSSIPVIDVRRTREKTSIWWQAVDTEVIPPW